jgi:hypothetical protein
MPRCALQSRRFTPRALNGWRTARRLYVHEMAGLLGMATATLKDKLYGRAPITLGTDRAIENIELLVARGVRPAGWPDRLMGRIVATSIGYIDCESAQALDSSPEELA